MKTLSGTRWSSRADATKALFANYDEIAEALIDISSDETQSDDTRSESCRLEEKMNKLETALMTVIWNSILERFNATSLSLQNVDVDLITVVKLYDSLRSFVSQMRYNFDSMEAMAKAYDTVTEKEYADANMHAFKKTKTLSG